MRVHACAFVCLRSCAFVCVRACVFVRLCVCVCVCVRSFICSFVRSLSHQRTYPLNAFIFALSMFLYTQLRFFYHMTGSWYSVGSLFIKLKNAITGAETTIWQMNGYQSYGWLRAIVPIATNWTVVQVRESRVSIMNIYSEEVSSTRSHLRRTIEYPKPLPKNY